MTNFANTTSDRNIFCALRASCGMGCPLRWVTKTHVGGSVAGQCSVRFFLSPTKCQGDWFPTRGAHRSTRQRSLRNMLKEHKKNPAKKTAQKKPRVVLDWPMATAAIELVNLNSNPKPHGRFSSSQGAPSGPAATVRPAAPLDLIHCTIHNAQRNRS